MDQNGRAEQRNKRVLDEAERRSVGREDVYRKREVGQQVHDQDRDGSDASFVGEDRDGIAVHRRVRDKR